MMGQKAKEGGLTEKELQEYLDKGGKITYCRPGERTENIEFKGGFYGKKTKKDDDQF